MITYDIATWLVHVIPELAKDYRYWNDDPWEEFVENIIANELATRYSKEDIEEAINDPKIQLIISLYKETVNEQADKIH